MKSQFIFAFAALLMIASLIMEGDCFTGPVPGKQGKVIYWNENILIRLGQLFPTDLLKKPTHGKSMEDKAFPIFQNSHFQNEDKCKTFPAKMRFICMRIIFILFKVTRPSYFVRVPSQLKLSGIPTFTLIISLTYSMDNILINLQYSIKFLAIGVNVTCL